MAKNKKGGRLSRFSHRWGGGMALERGKKNGKKGVGGVATLNLLVNL